MRDIDEVVNRRNAMVSTLATCCIDREYEADTIVFGWQYRNTALPRPSHGAT